MRAKERKIDIILFGIIFIVLLAMRWWGFHLLVFFEGIMFAMTKPQEFLIALSTGNYHSHLLAIYSITFYIFAPIGAIGIFFKKNWARILLIIFALIELNVTFIGIHELTFQFLRLPKHIKYLYYADGIILAIGTLVFLNLKSVRRRFKRIKRNKGDGCKDTGE